MCVCGAGRGGVVFPPLFSAVDLELRKYMFLPPAFMCMEWLSAIKKKKKKKRAVIAPHLKGAGKVTIPRGPPQYYKKR